ncbi:hypothetical protein CY34DRAFT_19972 [Suillus luteus UH-Slu-Lm8-n1]|uniref:Uncharacterized protein n=1 Tax=Suillus luteus UH-Slu-Lm8-n1 TaxID=930992 RepID=A0A0C9ZZN8_9AGAM|nr:hypothetical protein CY34DRAFT_19972 [Suillus luteus UH-Slu-Lm8-n1]
MSSSPLTCYGMLVLYTATPAVARRTPVLLPHSFLARFLALSTGSPSKYVFRYTFVLLAVIHVRSSVLGSGRRN